MKLSLISALGSASLLAVVACGEPGAEEQASTDQHNGVGPDGAEFVTVSVPGDHCKSVVLRGTTRFKGRAFVLPQPYVAANSQGAKLFQVLPKTGGGYTIRIGVYFPAGRADVGVAPSLLEQQPDCEYEYIRDRVNATVAEADQIGYPEPLSVNHMSVGVQGLSQKALIGHDNTDILAYSGKDYVLEFNAADDLELNAFLTRLRSTPGVQLSFDVHFSARASEGYSEVRINLRNAADRLDAGLTAGGNVYGVMARADFELALARAVTEVSADVYIEQSRDQAFADLTKELVARLVLNNPAVMSVALPAVPDGGAPARGAGGGGVLPSVDVRAALSAIRSMGEFSYRLAVMGDNVERVFTTNTIVRSNWSDPGTEFLRAYSDGTESTYMFSQNLNRGTTLTIAPQPRVTESIRYAKRVGAYHTRQALLNDEYHMASSFQRLQSAPNSLVQKADFPVYMYDGWSVNLFNWSYRTWGWETTEAEYGRATEKPTTFDDPGVKVEFAGSRRFTLKDLTTSNEYWDARVDNTLGQINLVLKANMEQLKLRNADRFATTEVYPLRRFEKLWSGSGTLKSTAYADDTTRPMPQQRSYVEIRVHAESVGASSIDARTIEVSPSADGVIRALPSR